MQVNKAFANKIYQAIRDSESSGFLFEIDELCGFSGAKIIGTLQRLCKLILSDHICYLEVGVFRGLTLLSVAKAAAEYPVYGIDNFCQFDPKGNNQSFVESQIHNLGLNHVHLINMDFEEALENLNPYIQDRKIGVYFVDGPHDYRSQIMCLELIRPYLADHAVIVVDDSNYQHVRQANRDFLVTHPDFKLFFEAYTPCHPNNMPKTLRQDAEHGWWNGLNIILKDPESILAPMYPPTQRNRTLFFNDHIIHSSRHAFFADTILSLMSSLLSFRIFRAAKELFKFQCRLWGLPREFKGRHLSLNTYSDTLPHSQYNSSLK